MVTLSNFDPANPSIPVQVNTGEESAGPGPSTRASFGVTNYETSSPEPTINIGMQRSLEVVSGERGNFNNRRYRGRLVNPSLTHNMGELEIVSPISSESTSVSRGLHISSNMPESDVSDKVPADVNRKQPV